RTDTSVQWVREPHASAWRTRTRGNRAMTLRNTPEKLVIGMDVGSTTVKAVVIDPVSKEILWSDYQRHLTKQPEKVMELLQAIAAAFPDRPFGAAGTWRMFLTGSGSGP